MPKKSYVTNMPDKAGAFLLASKIIAKHGGNIIRVSYNKAVDLHTLFIDVEADDQNVRQITQELETVGYINNKISETRVMIVQIKIPDKPGGILPVLKILDRYDINISYLNSSSDESGWQHFKMGLLIENPILIKMLLDDISELYQINIIDYDDIGEKLDNTIFYIRLANEMQKMLSLSTEKTMEFISESNRILQTLQDHGENPDKVFETIRKFACFISAHRGIDYKAEIETINICEGISLYSIQPPCGSNTYVLESKNELLLIDTGYAVYADELLCTLRNLFPDLEKRLHRVFITHADVDHCGLLSKLPDIKTCLNQKSAEGLIRQRDGLPDFRELNELNLGYSRLSKIISDYNPPDPAQFELIDSATPEHEELLKIGSFEFSGLEFEVYEGSGGHVYGEMVFVELRYGLFFTGDILLNISGFSKELSEFNSLAPYLMRSVNVDSRRATHMRKSVAALIETISEQMKKPCIVCGGHGPVSTMADGKLIRYQ